MMGAWSVVLQSIAGDKIPVCAVFLLFLFDTVNADLLSVLLLC